MLRLNIRDQFKLFVGKMPKVKGRNHLKLDDIVQEFGSDIFVINSGKISCKLCKIDIQVKKKQCVVRHCNSNRHKEYIKFHRTKPVTSTSESYKDTNSMFYIDLCRMMVSANIPLNKLNNKEFREFLEKYTHSK